MIECVGGRECFSPRDGPTSRPPRKAPVRNDMEAAALMEMNMKADTAELYQKLDAIESRLHRLERDADKTAAGSDVDFHNSEANQVLQLHKRWIENHSTQLSELSMRMSELEEDHLSSHLSKLDAKFSKPPDPKPADRIEPATLAPLPTAITPLQVHEELKKVVFKITQRLDVTEGSLQSLHKWQQSRSSLVDELASRPGIRAEPVDRSAEMEARLSKLEAGEQNLNVSVDDLKRNINMSSQGPMENVLVDGAEIQFPEQVNPGPKADDPERLSNGHDDGADGKAEHDSADEHIEFEFELSVWDSALFIGAGPMGAAGSLWMFLVLTINVGVQLMFATICYEEFTTSDYDDVTVKGYQAFRYKTGHDLRYLDGTTMASLESRICGLDASVELAGQQLDAVHRIDSYLPVASGSFFGEKQGQILCILALILWCLVVVQEIRRVLDTCFVFLLLIKNRGGPYSIFELKDDTRFIKSINYERLAVALAISLIRCWIACYLLISGLQWLAHTIDLRDLVLNAIGLQCVLDIDEMLFDALAPHPVRNFIQSLESVTLRAVGVWKGWDVPSGFSLVAVAGAVVVTFFLVLEPEVRNLRLAFEALCGGRLDFVYAFVDVPPYVYWTSSLAFGVVPADSNFASIVVKNVTLGHLENVEPVMLGSIKGGAWSLDSVSSMPPAKAASSSNSQCIDLVSERSFLDPKMVYLYRLSMSQGLSTQVQFCRDAAVRAVCNMDTGRGFMVRNICPRTCGCDNPMSGLVVTSIESGCPASCFRQQSYTQVVASASCNETPTNELVQNTVWRKQAEDIGRIGVDAEWPKHSTELLQQMSKDLLEFGCGAVPRMMDRAALDLCSEASDRPLSVSSLRLWCPETCNCPSKPHSDRIRCPLSCFPAHE